MPSFRTGVVGAMISEQPGLQRVGVDLGETAAGHVVVERAFVLTDLTGPVAIGDRVVINTTAVELGLGTGGWHVVHWNLERETWSRPGPGHIMKLRYTSLQSDTGAAEELYQDLPQTLDETPVVACTLHSQVAVVTAAIAHARPGTRVAYVMTDGGALPLAFSDLVGSLVDADLLVGTITAGHSFGGDLEAVNVPSAMILARHVQHAEAIVVGMGPGVVGTGSPLGTTAIEVAPVLDSVVALGGTPIICPRWSDADDRARHRGLSHHTRTALGLVASSVEVPRPGGFPSHADVPRRHRQREVDVPEMGSLLANLDVRVTTMGRGPEHDVGFFQHAGAAGVLAASLVVSAPAP